MAAIQGVKVPSPDLFDVHPDDIRRTNESGRCMTKLAKMSIDPKIIELTAELFGFFCFEHKSIQDRPNFTSQSIQAPVTP